MSTDSPRANAPAVDPLLLGVERQHSPGRYLASRGAASHLVASRALREALPADPTGAFTWSETLDGVPDTARTIHVDSPDDEADLLAAARARFPAHRILGLRHHLAPMFASDRQPLKHVPDDFRVDSLRRYVIACPARSGSTLLAQLLSQARAGKPDEHLRDLLVAAMRAPGVDRAEIWRQLAWRAQARGIFGSKLVAQFVLEAAGGRPAADLLDVLAPPGVGVVVLSRPLIDTVVSRVVSSAADLFHVRGTMDASERRRFAAVSYSFDRLHEVLVRNRAENQGLVRLLSGVPAERQLHVTYAELEADPLGTLERVCAFVGATPVLGGVDRDRLPVKISDHVDTHRRLAERFLADLEERGEPLDPTATV